MPTGIDQTHQKRPGDALPLVVSFAEQVQDADGELVDSLSRRLDDHQITVRHTPPSLLLDVDVSDLDAATITIDEDRKVVLSGFERMVVQGVGSAQATVENAIRDLDVANPVISFMLKPDVGEVGETLYITVRAMRDDRGPSEKVIQVDIRD